MLEGVINNSTFKPQSYFESRRLTDKIRYVDPVIYRKIKLMLIKHDINWMPLPPFSCPTFLYSQFCSDTVEGAQQLHYLEKKLITKLRQRGTEKPTRRRTYSWRGTERSGWPDESVLKRPASKLWWIKCTAQFVTIAFLWMNAGLCFLIDRT